jgi:hypothetical protein
MMTCKEVSTRLLRDESEGVRLQLWMHLAFCRYCRAFRRQLRLMRQAARATASRFASEAGAEFVSRTVDRISSRLRFGGDSNP